MRPHRVEVTSPGLDDYASLREGVEDLSVEKFIAQPCIEALDEAILPRTTWCDVGGLGTHRGDPFLHRLRDKFGPVIGPNMLRHAACDEEIREHVDDVDRFQLPLDADGDALMRELINDIEHPVLPPFMGAVFDEVVRPDMVAPLRPKADAGPIVEP